jgi:hypothetical protein
MSRIIEAQRHAALVEALADWQDSVGPSRTMCRTYALYLLRAARRERDAERAVVARKAAAHRMRNSAASLRLLASLYDGNADYGTDRREIDAWDGAHFYLEEAAAALEDGAASIAPSGVMGLETAA